MLRALERLEQHGYSFGARRVVILTTSERTAVGDRVAGLLDVATARAPLEHAYYSGGLRYQIWVTAPDGAEVPLIDGGAFDWLTRLAANRRAVFIATGAGAQLIVLRFRKGERQFEAGRTTEYRILKTEQRRNEGNGEDAAGRAFRAQGWECDPGKHKRLMRHACVFRDRTPTLLPSRRLGASGVFSVNSVSSVAPFLRSGVSVTSVSSKASAAVSLLPDRHQRIDAHRPPRGHIAGERGDRQQTAAVDGIAHRIERRDVEEHGRDRAAPGASAPARPMATPTAASFMPPPTTSARTSPALGADGHPHADLPRALADRIRHHAVEADRREEQRRRREGRQQQHREPPLRDRLGDDTAQRASSKGGQCRVDLAQRLPRCGRELRGIAVGAAQPPTSR